MINYFGILHAAFGNAQMGLMPQFFRTHTKTSVQTLLKCLSRTGVKLGGKLADNKGVLAERLAHGLNKVVEAGREASEAEMGNGEATDEEGHETSAPNTHRVGKLLVPAQQQMGEIPPDAIVTAEQTESALGRARSASTVRTLKSSVAVGCPHEVAAGASDTPARVSCSACRRLRASQLAGLSTTCSDLWEGWASARQALSADAASLPETIPGQVQIMGQEGIGLNCNEEDRHHVSELTGCSHESASAQE